MREWLIFATETTIVVIDAMALVVIVVGTVEAFVSGLRLMIGRSTNGAEKRTSSRHRSPRTGRRLDGSPPSR
jgi:hypothetical protein